MGGNGREREWAFQAEGAALVMAERNRASLQFRLERGACVGEEVGEREGLDLSLSSLRVPQKLECVHSTVV